MDRPQPTVIEFDGGNLPPELRKISIRGDLNRYSISPDGLRIAFTTIQGRFNGHTVRLYCLRQGEKSAHPLVGASGQAAPWIARWSPDSRRILFHRIFYPGASINADGSPLFDIHAGGGELRLLTQKLWGEGSDGIMYWPEAIAFSPDGLRLLLVQGYSRFPSENKRLVCRDYPSGRFLWMSEPKMATIEPVWSPDGRQIAYIATPDSSGNDEELTTKRLPQEHLWVRDSDGRHSRKLTADPRFRESKPRWVVGRHAIRFERDDNADRAPNVAFRSRRSLWEVRPDGTGLHKIRDLPPDPPEE